MGFNTDVLYAGRREAAAQGATIPPLVQSSAFAYRTMEDLERVFANRAPGFVYTRVGNPTVAAFERRVAALEHGFAAVACASGMAAVAQTFQTILTAGDEVLASAGLYGGTIQFNALLRNLGITVRYVPDFTPDELETLVTERTRLVFGEVISNPGLGVTDIRAVAEWSHAHGLPLVLDSTTATPFLVRPLELGADIVIHSTSKYINGSGNGVSGIVVDSGRFRWDFDRYPALAPFRQFGPLAAHVRLRQDVMPCFGGCLAPFNAYLNLVGVETLGLRMERICRNASALAHALAEIPGVTVNHPSLDTHPQSALARCQFRDGLAGGILTLRLGSRERALRTAERLRYATIASNIGDVRTLVIYPATTLFAHNTPEERTAAGVFDDTLRVSVGIEDPEDLVQDFTNAVETDTQGEQQ